MRSRVRRPRCATQNRTPSETRTGRSPTRGHRSILHRALPSAACFLRDMPRNPPGTHPVVMPMEHWTTRGRRRDVNNGSSTRDKNSSMILRSSVEPLRGPGGLHCPGSDQSAIDGKMRSTLNGLFQEWRSLPRSLAGSSSPTYHRRLILPLSSKPAGRAGSEANLARSPFTEAGRFSSLRAKSGECGDRSPRSTRVPGRISPGGARWGRRRRWPGRRG